MPSYYINPTGSNSAGRDGLSSATAWANLYYAAGRAIEVGDKIIPAPGTYIETARCTVRPGVSIEGTNRNTTIFKVHFTASNIQDAYMVFTTGTSSTQHVTGITLDGDGYTGNNAIIVYDRKFVDISYCIIKDFEIQGVRFDGGSLGNNGNSLHNNIISDCNGVSGDRRSGIFIKNQTGLLVYENDFTQIWRPVWDTTGDGIRYEGGNRGVKIYRNNLNGLYADQANQHNEWCFLFEAWDSNKDDGIGWGLEFYENNIVGEVDFGSGLNKGTYPFSLSFHDNRIGDPATHGASIGKIGVQFEEIIWDVLIYKNKIKNLDRPIYFCNNGTVHGSSSGGDFRRINIHSNIVHDITYNYSHGGAVTFAGSGSPSRLEDITIRNNTFDANIGSPAEYGIYLDGRANSTRIIIQNNIVEGFSLAAVKVLDNGGSMSYLTLQKNLFYGNGNSNNLSADISVSNLTNDGGTKSDPLFVDRVNKDYHLTQTSPAKWTGMGVGLLTDYDGVVWASPNPSRGALEFQSGVPVIIPVTSVIVTGTGGSTTITVDKATLQMIATVLPENATNKNVTWSVVNGTGQATINSSGLLTPVKNGTVTVKANSIG
jgi:hypothetical protein